MRCGVLWISDFFTCSCSVSFRHLLGLVLIIQHLIVGATGDKQTVLTVCDGDNAAFNWPCDVQYDRVKSMTLTYSWSGRQGVTVATIDNSGSVTVDQKYAARIQTRGTSGLYLNSVSIQDSGVYIFDGQFQNGTNIRRHHVSLVVHVPPLLESGSLQVQMSNLSQRCQGLSCGSLLFMGYPPVSIEWMAPNSSEASGVSNERNVIEGCPLLYGSYSCRLAGPAVKCLRDKTLLEESVFVNVSWVQDDGSEDYDLVLIITIPIVAVMCPLMVLGLWVLKHLCTDNTYRHLSHSSSSSPMNRSASRTSALVTDSPGFSPQPSSDEAVEGNQSQTEEDKAEDEEEEDDDPTAPMMKPDSESGSGADVETRI